MKTTPFFKVSTRTILVATALSLSGCGGHEETAKNEPRKELPRVVVSVAQASQSEVASQVRITGAVQANERASIAPKVMGTIREFPVSLGESVKKGDLLAKIDAAEIEAKVLQAEAQLQQAERDLGREESLLEKGASTSEMVKNLRDRVTIMRAMADEARVMRGYTEIRAPFDGTVARAFSDVGNLASPGMPLLELVGSDNYEIEAGIPESIVGQLTIGARFSAQLPANGESFEATLKEISSGADGYSRTVTATFSIPKNVSARVGQFARITLESGSNKAILVPTEAISRLGQMERLFVVEDGHAKLRLIKTGAGKGTLTEVLSGIDSGETIVATADKQLLDGQPIEVR